VTAPAQPARTASPARVAGPVAPTLPAAASLDVELARAARAVAEVPSGAPVLLTCHVGPDGDALGSMLAFGLALRRLGFTDVSASFPEPFDVPEAFAFLSGLDLLVRAADVPARPALAVSFDASAPSRLDGLTDALEAAPTWIVVDHHASNVGFGSVRVIDPDAAATAVLAAELITRIGVELDQDIATCLYVGLVTDTGSFKFDATTSAVLGLASRLVEAGAHPADVARRVFDTRPFAAIRLLGEVLDRAELDPAAAGGRGLVSAYATAAQLRHHGQSAQVLESFMDVIRTAAEADVACLLKPVADGEWSVSLRSRGGTDVSIVAVALGGGGHRLAAGFTRRGDVHDVLAAVRAELDR
jgi:bifunctional oligoribonuclease and PAP phosphatase NrnA